VVLGRRRRGVKVKVSSEDIADVTVLKGRSMKIH